MNSGNNISTIDVKRQMLWLTLSLSLVLNTPTQANSGLASIQEQEQLQHQNLSEDQLITTLQDIQNQRFDGALEKIESLVQKNPKFKLAQLIYADLLLAKTGPINDFGNPLLGTGSISDINKLKQEAQARWRHHLSHPGNDIVPGNLIKIADNTKHIVIVDLSRSRLYLYANDNGKLSLVTDHYVSIGKNGAIKEREGDKKTPIGVYHVTEFLAPDKLPDFYGSGAFPINYPNVIDKLAGKTGYGIWLHGTPLNTYSRSPRASDGCVTLSNNDFLTIKPLITPGKTPVIITDSIDWQATQVTTRIGDEFDAILEGWQQDWQSLDVDRYLSHYSNGFRSETIDYERWASHKRRIGKNKSFINIDLSEVSIFVYPGQNNLRIVTFKQNYYSNNYKQSSHKQQHWRQEEDGTWRIIYEGPA